jgi:bacillithiol system protein YtxJ
MKKEFTDINDTDALEELIARSHNEPVILFKHSTACPISAAAYNEMSQVPNDVSLVVVQRARDVSQEVAKRTGVRHESPQTIILRNGQAVWNRSHWSIKAEEVETALREYT